MSYDLYIVPARPGLTPAEVGEALERAELEDTDRPFGVPPEAFRACLDEILRRHPPMEGMSDEEIDRSIWSIDPGCEGGYIGLCMRWSTTPEQISGIIDIAHRHGFAVHDQQEGAIYPPPGARPGGLAGLIRRLFGR